MIVPSYLLTIDSNQAAIYGILNLVNGKVYIGSAVEVKNRLRTHKSRLNLKKHPSKHLQGAWNEYGEFAFEFLTLEYCSKGQLLEREEAWFNLTNCCDPKCGYNKRKTPNSNLGLKLGPASDARKRRMSEIHTGRIISEEQREKSRRFLTGRKLSAEHIANAIKGRASFAHSEETKARMRVAAKTRSSEHQWPHEKGYDCNCRECLDQKNLIRRLKRYNHEGEFCL